MESISMARKPATRSDFLIDAENARIALRARLRIVPGFRLLWGRTWPKERGLWAEDFVGVHPDHHEQAVRIFRDGTTPDRRDLWCWTAGYLGYHVANGWEADARTAARAAEASYWRRREETLKSEIRDRLGRHVRPLLP